MGFITDIVNGDSYDKKILRREKTSNGFKNVLDKAAEIEDPDTGEKLLKFKSDGLQIPKPEAQQFEVVWYRDWIDKVTRTKSHTDFMEVYLKELGDDAHGDFVTFEPAKKELELMGSESQFQTHRDLEAEKTLDIFSEDGMNQQYIMIGALALIVIIDVAGKYIASQSMEESVYNAMKRLQETGASAVSQGQNMTGNWVLFAFAGSQAMKKVKASTGNLYKSVRTRVSSLVGQGK